MSTEQSEPPVDSRIIFGGLAVVLLAALALVFDPVAFVSWVVGFTYKAVLAVLVSVITAVLVMIIGGVVLAVILGVGQLFGYSDD